MNWYRLLKLSYIWPYGYWILPDGEAVDVPLFGHASMVDEILEKKKEENRTGGNYTEANARKWCRVVMPRKGDVVAIMEIDATRGLTQEQKGVILDLAKDAATYSEGEFSIKTFLGLGGDDEFDSVAAFASALSRL